MRGSMKKHGIQLSSEDHLAQVMLNQLKLLKEEPMLKTASCMSMIRLSLLDT